MTLEQLNQAHGDALEVANDLREMMLDHPQLKENINWLKRYCAAMDNLHDVEMEIVEYYQLENSIYKK